MNFIFSAVFLLLILLRIYASAYAGPSEARSRLNILFNIGLALLFVAFCGLIAQHVVQLLKI